MGKPVFFLLLFALLAVLAPSGMAEDQDIIILKEGGMYKGDIVSETRSTVKIKVKGKLITLKRKEIRKIIARFRPEAEYKKKAKALDKKDGEGHYELALWCRENNLKAEGEKHFKTVIKLAPDHEGARKALGYGFYNEEWLTSAQLDALGLVWFEDSWIAKEELEGAILKRREKRFEELDSLLSGGADEAEALMKELGHTFKSIKLQGEQVYKRFKRDATRLYVIYEPQTSPDTLPGLGLEVMNGLIEAEGAPMPTLAYLVNRSGGEYEAEDLEPLWTQPERSGNNLYAALLALGVEAGEPYDGEDRKTLRTRCERVPEPLRDGLAVLVGHYAHACLLRNKAFEDVLEEDLEDIVSRDNFGKEDKLLDSLDFAKEVSFMGSYALLAQSARVLYAGAMEFSQFLKDNPLPTGIAQRTMIFTTDTPFGKIVISGTGENWYEEDVAFLVDLGGKDTYQAHFACSAAAPSRVSLLLDLDGDDTYIADEDENFGCGHFGVGLLLDLAGNDSYSTTSHALGSAFVGCGLLYDRAGNDSYECGYFGQGCGIFGHGFLIDGEGNDKYILSKQGQGFGSTYGIGLLLDGSGDDTFTAGGGQGLDALDVEASACYAQGAGQGFRPKITGQAGSGEDLENLFIAGGWGILADLAGNDEYQAYSYAQGAGTLSGLGMLLDRWGDDTYKGYKMAQGMGNGLGAGLLMDNAGDDRYEITDSGQGCAMNLAVGALVDCYGEDRYKAGAKSLGYVMSRNCLALFMDLRGDDEYAGNEMSFGFAENETGSGMEGGSLGLFLDLAGLDAYRGRPGAGNNNKWTQENNVGGGLDREPEEE